MLRNFYGITIIIGLSLPMVVQAENWVSVFTDSAKGTVVYIDADSASRKGDLGTITIKSVGEGGGSSVSTDTAQFDCNLKTTIEKGRSVKISEELPATRNLLLKILEKACKRPWEVWK